ALRCGGVVDREGQRRGGVEHLDVAGHDLHLARGEVGVHVVGRAGHDLAGDLEAELVAQAVGDLFVAHDDLDDAARLTQVEEGDATVIATTRHPAGKDDGLADVLGAQGAGVMSADHWISADAVCEMACGRRSSVGGVQVAGSAVSCSPERMSLTWWVPSSWVNQTYGMPRRSA